MNSAQAHRRSGCRSLVVLSATVYAGANDGAISAAPLEDDVFKLRPPPRDGSSPKLLPPHGALARCVETQPQLV